MKNLRQSATTLGLAIAATLAISPFAFAQDMGSPSGPIDIQADEQEFATDHVIARGRVRVLYGDTTIRAPIATLYRDEAGQPKLAVFTGNPTLTQGTNIVKAVKLTFDIKAAKIIAEGSAHSEVLTSSMAQAAPAAKPDPKAAKKKKDKEKKPFEFEEEDPASIEGGPEAAAPAEEIPTEEGGAKPPVKKATEDKPQRIITDSDKQEFERNTGKFEAIGHVRVRTGEIKVNSNHLRLVYGTDQKPEAVVFTGDVVATRENNETHADVMTYFLTTQRMQATGHVRSKVVQKAAAPAGGGTPVAVKGSAGAVYAAAPATAGTTKIMDFNSGPSGAPMTIISDSQDYNRQTGRMDAEGMVKVLYGDTVGMGPKITVTTDENGQADRVIFVGRSQINQTGRRWIADRITFTVKDNKVLAEGNTRAIIVKAAPKPVQPVPVKTPSRFQNEHPGELAGGSKTK